MKNMKLKKLIIVLVFTALGIIFYKLFDIKTLYNNSIKYNIMIDNVKSNNFPTTSNYTVSVDCDSGKGTVTWNPKLATPAWEFKFEKGYVLDNSSSSYVNRNIITGDSCNIVFSQNSNSNKLSERIKSFLDDDLDGDYEVASGANGTLKNEEYAYDNNNSATSASGVYYDLGIRYKGSNPNNYIRFNDELWRIIGIFRGPGGRSSTFSDNDPYYTKIIRNDSIGVYQYNMGSSGTDYWIKNGTLSPLNKLLNYYYTGANGYYSEDIALNTSRNYDFNLIGLKDGWLDMVINTIWATGDGGHQYINNGYNNFINEHYQQSYSRGARTYVDTTNFIYSRVGLMNGSDMLYSGSGSPGGGNVNNKWLAQGREWTINPGSINGYAYSTYGGSVQMSQKTNYYMDVRPVVYLSDKVYITGGSGTILDPYTIAAPPTITYTFDEMTLTVLSGTTWEEWQKTSSAGYFVGNNLCVNGGVVNLSGSAVSPSDLIQAETYTIYTDGGECE